MAETLEEFRGNYVYNMLDEHVRRFNAEVPQLVQWDDHETTDNWFLGGVLDERHPRFTQYTVKSHDLLVAYGPRAVCLQMSGNSGPTRSPRPQYRTTFAPDVPPR